MRSSSLIPSRALAAALVALATAAGTLAAAYPAFAVGEAPLAALDTAYTENFGSLASAGTSSVVPSGWSFVEIGTNANTTYTAGTGSSTTGDTYSFGATASTERALGALLSGSLTPTIGAGFTNSTGGTITSVDIAYTGEQWRIGTAARVDRLDFQFSTDATGVTSGSWTDVNALDFTSPNTVAIGATDGNAAVNRTALTSTIEGLSLAPGATLWIRWNDFNASGADDGLAVDDFSLTPHGSPTPTDQAPSVVSSTPTNNATGVPTGSDLSVTFSEDVTLGTGAFRLFCNGTAVPFTFSGSGSSYTVDPSADFSDGASCNLTVEADAVSDVDTDDPPDQMAADYRVFFYGGDLCGGGYTPAFDIQGSGATAAVTGSTTTRGVVVGDYEAGGLDGFYLQDLGGDGDAATSDAVFVFSPGRNDVNVGDVVWVAGTAGEFQGQTQVSRFSGVPVVSCGTGSVEPTDVMLPFASASYPERYEGMLARMPQTLSVTEHFQLGRFGEVRMSVGGRLPEPTNVVEPGPAAVALKAANALKQIVVDDALQTQNPDPIVFGRGGQPLSASNTLRGGDTATGMVGVLTFTWAGNAASGNTWRLRPVNALGGGVPDFQPANPRPVSAPTRGADVDVRVAGMNLLNFFDDLDTTGDNCRGGLTGAVMDCRGANNVVELQRQTAKTVAAVTGGGADVVGIAEIENDGYGPTSAIQYLIDKLNTAAGAGTYAFIDADAATGQTDALGNDAIKVGFLYKPAVVTPVGQTAALNSVAFVNGGDSGPRNRAALAQAFEDRATGARFVASVNHLKSKGSPCDAPDIGDGQANCNQVRVNAANLLTQWLKSDPTGTGDPDALIIGDLNSYAKEDPIDAIKAAGFTNLIEDRIGANAYSYVFNGEWGYLDHALANSSMSGQVSDVAEWHINADEPSVLDYNTDFKSAGQIASLYSPDEFRISDHDPVIVDLDLTVPFDFSGFFDAVANPPAVNSIKAGSTVAVKFSLGGDQGLDVFASGPTVTPVDCTTLEPVGGTSPAGGSGLHYDAVTDTYWFGWKTDKAARGTCQSFSFELNDATGVTKTAYFSLH
jgi:predicted extracellular nuclease